MVYVIYYVHHRDKRVTEIDYNSYDMWYFSQHVLLCTSTVHDQPANICYLYSGIFKDPLDTKHKIFKKKKTDFINVMFHVLNWSISLKVVKLNNPWMCIICNKWPWDGTLKTYRKNVACRAGSTIGLRCPPFEKR